MYVEPNRPKRKQTHTEKLKIKKKIVSMRNHQFSKTNTFKHTIIRRWYVSIMVHYIYIYNIYKIIYMRIIDTCVLCLYRNSIPHYITWKNNNAHKRYEYRLTHYIFTQLYMYKHVCMSAFIVMV